MSRATTVAGLGVAACGVVYGGYYYNQASYINKFLQDEKSAHKLVEAEQKKLKTCSVTLAEQEGRQKSLGQSLEEFTKAAQKAESELEAARKNLARLEQEHEAKHESVKKVTKDLEAVASKINSLKQESDRAAAALTLGEKSLQLARQQASEAKKLLNPLNHPSLQGFIGRGK